MTNFINRVTPFLWTRGVAQVSGDQISLDPRASGRYAPCIDVPNGAPKPFEAARVAEPFSGSLLFDLAALPRPIRAKDAKKFAARHGLLWHGVHDPDAADGPNATQPVETLRDWEKEAQALYALLEQYRDLRNGLTEGKTVPEYLELVIAINQRLSQAHPQLVAGTQLRDEWIGWWKPPAVKTKDKIKNTDQTKAQTPTQRRDQGQTYRPAILRDAIVPNLVVYAYFQLSAIVEYELPIEQCKECRSFFIVRDQRMKYCSSACRVRVYGRQNYARQRAKRS